MTFNVIDFAPEGTFIEAEDVVSIISVGGLLLEAME